MYTAFLTLAVAGALAVATVRIVGRVLAVDSAPLETTPFLSGHAPEEHALSRFHVRWYVATVVFLAFDVEMLFMYPWAVVVSDLGIGAVVEMFAFLGALLIAVAWARREGAFRWV